MNAMQMLMAQMGLNPEELKTSAENIGKLVTSIDQRLAVLERQNIAIMSHLGVSTEPETAAPEKAPLKVIQG